MIKLFCASTGLCPLLYFIGAAFILLVWGAGMSYLNSCLCSPTQETSEQNRSTQRSAQLDEEEADLTTKRNLYVRTTLSAMSWVLTTDGTSSSQSSDSDVESGEVQTFTNISSDQQAECSICLGDFEHGGIVCRSNNPDCCHLFHKECIVEWLLRNNRCPCCRSKYLESDQPDTKKLENTST